MGVQKDTIFEQFLAPVFRLFLDEETLLCFNHPIDWQKELSHFCNPTVIYPTYYNRQDFQEIQGGYLNPQVALSYDQIIPYLLPPTELLARQGLINFIQSKPRRILDIGCGTGSQTLMLKKAFPDCSVIGLDLSPYMLVIAHQKALHESLNIQWRHGQGEKTGFPDTSFDLITIALLFHEIPPEIAQAILQEAFRLLTPGGEVIVLDGNQKLLRQAEWLTNLLENPYRHSSYIHENVESWMSDAGFGAVMTEDLWIVNQLTRGVKPIPGQEIDRIYSSTKIFSEDPEDFPESGELPGIPVPT